MPSGEALHLAISRIQSLEPKPEIIAPRLGGLIHGPSFARYSNACTGWRQELSFCVTRPGKSSMWALPMAILAALEKEVGHERLASSLACVARDPSCYGLFVLEGTRIRSLKPEPVEALRHLVFRLRKGPWGPPSRRSSQPWWVVQGFLGQAGRA